MKLDGFFKKCLKIKFDKNLFSGKGQADGGTDMMQAAGSVFTIPRIIIIIIIIIM
jgi:hypothetical protein